VNNSAPVTSGDSVVSLIEKGNALEEQGRPGEAMECYEAAVQADPRCARAHLNRGNILLASARTDEARNAYQLAVACDPHYAAAYFNLANLNCRAGEYEQALQHYGVAIRIKPDFADAFVALGNALADLGRTAEAIESYQRALAITPNYADVHLNLGLLAMKLNRFHDALDSCERALRIAPDCHWLYGTWLHAKMQLCDWNNVNSQITTLVAGAKHHKKITPPFPLLALTDSLSAQLEAAQTWVNDKYPPTCSLPPIKKRRRSEKIRIGYYSADYHGHATAYLMAELFERHDRKRFEVVAFSYGPDKRDDMRQRLATAFDRFVDVRTK
jgi:predicted O-linked N-acetylglucosamine transferase (SPINDLY family)